MEKITREEYIKLVEGCKPHSSFSDPDGILSFGYGCPAMDTVWGKDNIDIVRCEMRKENRHQTEWEYTYYRLTYLQSPTTDK